MVEGVIGEDMEIPAEAVMGRRELIQDHRR